MSAAKTGEMRVEVLKLFATPVAIARLPGAEAINRELERVILERANSHPGTQHSNLGGWQSTWDFIDWGGPALARVLEAARRLADRLTVDRQGRPAKVDWKINCWANVNRRGHGNEFHTHPGAYWSGSYYVDDGYGRGRENGGGEGGEHGGGEFEVQDPRGVAPAMYAPMLTFAGPDGASLGASQTLTPEAGMVILFPSWLQHGVRPYRGDGRRISVAFNMSV